MGRKVKGQLRVFDPEGRLVTIGKTFRSQAAKRDWLHEQKIEALKPKLALTDLFGDQRPIKRKAIPGQKTPGQEEKERRENQQNIMYDTIGVPRDRHKPEASVKGDKCCILCGNDRVKIGFYMGFAHFCACASCIERGLDDFAAPGPKLLGYCFRCGMGAHKMGISEEAKRKFLKPVHLGTYHPEHDYYDNGTTDYICLDCLVLGHSLLQPLLLAPVYQRPHHVAVTGEGKGSYRLNL